MIIVNNELFDAFPIMKFIYTEKGWCELLVDLKEDFLTDADFKFSKSEVDTSNVKNLLKPEKTFEGIKFKEGDQYEFSPDCNLFYFTLLNLI